MKRLMTMIAVAAMALWAGADDETVSDNRPTQVDVCTIHFVADDVSRLISSVEYRQGEVDHLPPCSFKPPKGMRFAGWRGSDGKRYDDRMLVFEFSAAELTLKAIWEPILEGVQLWENGPCWAECNVGATKPEEYGYYFWWGGTVGYAGSGTGDHYDDVTWMSSTGVSVYLPFGSFDCPTYEKDNAQLQSEGYIDSTGSLVAAHDAATEHLGAPWRMPTSVECEALRSNCDTEWTTLNGVYGCRVTGRGAFSTKSIFLPAAGYGDGWYLDEAGSYGYYWSSTPYSNSSDEAYFLYFDSGHHSGNFNLTDYLRYRGLSVRPVRGFAQ